MPKMEKRDGEILLKQQFGQMNQENTSGGTQPAATGGPFAFSYAVELGNTRISHQFPVVGMRNTSCILGADFLKS